MFKRLSEQNYYQILDIPTNATKSEIIRAYQLAQETYGTDSLATYSLMSPEERRRIMTKIREAYQILVDDESRSLYDQYLMKTGQISGERLLTRTSILTSREGMLEEASPPVERSFSGEELKRIRETKDIDLRRISEETKINITYLRAIEEENFSLLPPVVYLKGFLTQYARFLRLDPERVKADYLKLYEAGIKRKP